MLFTYWVQFPNSLKMTQENKKNCYCTDRRVKFAFYSLTNYSNFNLGLPVIR